MAQSSTKDTQRGGDGDADGELQLELRLTDWLTDADTRWPHKMQHAKRAQLTAAKDKHKRFHLPPSLSPLSFSSSLCASNSLQSLQFFLISATSAAAAVEAAKLQASLLCCCRQLNVALAFEMHNKFLTMCTIHWRRREVGRG